MAGEAALEVVDATKAIDGLTVLDGVSFRAEPGRVTALLGPNGAGKSSLLRAVLGVDSLDRGTALVGGRPLREHRRPLAVAGGTATPSPAARRREPSSACSPSAPGGRCSRPGSTCTAPWP